MAGRARIRYACGHEGCLHSFGRGAMREKHLQWAKEAGLCPQCRLKKLFSETSDDAALERSRRDNEISLQSGAPGPRPVKKCSTSSRRGSRHSVQAVRCEKKRARREAGRR